MEKKCYGCKKRLPLILFNKNKSFKDGLEVRCRPCRKLDWKKNYIKYKEKHLLRASKYAKQNIELVRYNRKKYYLKNKELEYENNKKWVKNNISRRRSANKNLYNLNKKNPYWKIKNNLRCRLYQAIKNDYRSGSAVRDLGCTIDYFKKYLESKFSKDMSWSNYGKGIDKWNIDHIIPLSSFDLTNREQLLKACNYTNLQPLWQVDNCSKGAKY